MYLHADSKARYQTHPNTLCDLHKLQIVSGTIDQIRIENLKVKPQVKNEKQNQRGRTKEQFSLNAE